jgi:hypothetical protein
MLAAAEGVHRPVCRDSRRVRAARGHLHHLGGGGERRDELRLRQQRLARLVALEERREGNLEGTAALGSEGRARTGSVWIGHPYV